LNSLNIYNFKINVGGKEMDYGVIISVLLVMLAMLVYGIYIGRGSEKTYEGLFLADRGITLAPLSVTFAASWASSYTIFAAAEMGYRFGIMGPIWYGVAIAIGMGVILPLMAKKIRSEYPNGLTLPHYIEAKFDTKNHFLFTIGSLLGDAIQSVALILGVGLVLNVMAGFPLLWGIVIGGAVVVIYITFGGMKAVVGTDVVQLILIGIGMIVAILGTISVMDFSRFVVELPNEKLNLFGWPLPSFIAIGVAFLLWQVATPLIWQRIYAGIDTKTTVRAAVLSGPMFAGVAFGAGIIGVMASYTLPGIDPAAAVTEFAKTLPYPILILFTICFVSAIISSTDSYINSVAGVFTKDLYQKYFRKNASIDELHKAGKVFTLIFGAFCIMVASLFSNSILGLLMLQASILMAFAMPLLFALFWERTTPNALFISSLSMLVFAIVLNVYNPWGIPIIPVQALVSSMLIYVISLTERSYRTVISKQSGESLEG
jgi:Na+/proline symporter